MKLPRRQRDKLPAGGLGVNLAALELSAGVSVNLAALGLADGSEAEFQAVVLQIAAAGGWAVFSVPDSRKASCEGFPDGIAMHPTGPTPLLAFELKTAKGRLRKGQGPWLDAFKQAGVPCYLWRPESLAEIEAVFSHRG